MAKVLCTPSCADPACRLDHRVLTVDRMLERLHILHDVDEAKCQVCGRAVEDPSLVAEDATWFVDSRLEVNEQVAGDTVRLAEIYCHECW